MPEIVLKHVSKRWGKFVGVNDLNLNIPDHSFITLLGPSGCGKTTTLRMIAGLETPTEGEIWIGNTCVYNSNKGINIPPDKRDIGFLFQNYALWPHMTAYQNIAFGLENLKWKKEEIKARVEEMAHTLKIEQFLQRYPSELSGGQQQRVAIARTLAPKPQVLFMDEPLSNLDAKLRLEMRTELKRLHATTNATFIYVTHDQLEAMTLATKICLIKEGVMQQYDPPLYVYAHPANLFVADFVGSPAINMLTPLSFKKEGKESMLLDFKGTKARLKFGEPFEADPKKIAIGIRPEYIRVLPKGEGNPAKVYSSLPSGMSTTVRLEVGDNALTSVVFGIIDYPVGEEIGCDFVGNGIMLFDAESGNLLAEGSLENLSQASK
jgi:multiple sugar transport system ATP-binding protein